jgi:hypothetical protein
MLIRMFANTFCTEIPLFSKEVRVQFEGGVIIAADTLGSYGSLAKITNLDRVIKVRNINLQHIGSLNATWYVLVRYYRTERSR